jgi:GNAT superfamily N-acetyltransferase
LGSNENEKSSHNQKQSYLKIMFSFILSERSLLNFLPKMEKESFKMVFVRPAIKADRMKILKLHFTNHLTQTCRNLSEKQQQIHHLNSDFPYLFSDSEFMKSIFWVAEINNTVIGSIGLIIKEKSALITCFSVDPLWQNRKIGSLLFDTVMQYTQTLCIESLILYTLPDRHVTAYQMYLKRGFKTTKVIKNGLFVLNKMRLNKLN